MNGTGKMKRLQYGVHNKDIIVQKMVSFRSWAVAKAGLPPYPVMTTTEAKTMVLEAHHSKLTYKYLLRGTQHEGRNKSIFGKLTAMHLWWKLMYGAINVCLAKMGLDPDLGVIHRCNNGFIYDIADLLKPLFIKTALASMPGSAQEFWFQWVSLKMPRALPTIILWLIGIDPGYSWRHSRHGRDWRHNLNMPTP
jgi:hypothetical protein